MIPLQIPKNLHKDIQEAVSHGKQILKDMNIKKEYEIDIDNLKPVEIVLLDYLTVSAQLLANSCKQHKQDRFQSAQIISYCMLEICKDSKIKNLYKVGSLWANKTYEQGLEERIKKYGGVQSAYFKRFY